MPKLFKLRPYRDRRARVLTLVTTLAITAIWLGVGSIGLALGYLAFELGRSLITPTQTNAQAMQAARELKILTKGDPMIEEKPTPIEAMLAEERVHDRQRLSPTQLKRLEAFIEREIINPNNRFHRILILEEQDDDAATQQMKHTSSTKPNNHIILDDVLEASGPRLRAGAAMQVIQTELSLLVEHDWSAHGPENEQLVLEGARLLKDVIAADLVVLHRDGDTSSDDPFLALRDGARKGNHTPLTVHSITVETVFSAKGTSQLHFTATIIVS